MIPVAPTTDERIARLESAVANIGESVKAIAHKVEGLGRTNWTTLIGFGGLTLTIIGAAWVIYSRDQERHAETFKAIAAMQEKTEARFESRLRDSDANLQREQRQLDATIEQKVSGLAELQRMASDVLDDRLTALEAQVRQGLQERWSKVDHTSYATVAALEAQAMLRRIERLEAFHMRGP